MKHSLLRKEMRAGARKKLESGQLRMLCMAAWLLLFGTYGASAQTVELRLPHAHADVGEEVTIPVDVSNVVGKGVISFIVRVSYDPAVLSDEFTASINGTVSEGEQGVATGVRVSPPDEGYFTVVYYRNGSKPIEKDGTLVNLTSTVVGEGTTALEFTYVLLERTDGSVESVGIEGSFSTEVVVSDPDGISDAVEDGVPNLTGGGKGDGNGDGTPDSQQANVASLLNETDGSYVTVASDDGTQLRSVSTSGTLPAPAPDGVEMPDGVVSFEVTGVASGGSATVTIYTSNDANRYFKYGPTPDDGTAHWYSFDFDGTTGAEFLGDRIVLHFVDGMRGDGDLSANGIVVDPGAPAYFTNVSVENGELPDGFRVNGNYPNPFNPSTTVRFDLPETADVAVAVYDLLGRQVLALPATMLQAGADRSIRVDADELSSGTYVYRVVARSASNTMVKSGRMTLLK